MNTRVTKQIIRQTQASAPVAKQRRNLAVDALRGLTMFLMVMVNNPGDYARVFPQLRHSDWNGFTVADLIYPFFLLLVGVSVSFSVHRRVLKGKTPGEMLLPAFSRTLKLVSLGLLDNAFPFFELNSWRLPGVLQRIGVVYGLSFVLAWRLKTKSLVWLTAILLLGYWGLITLVAPPGLSAPNLSVPADNLAAWLDYKLMAGHLFLPGAKWDPEGLLSTIPALALTLIGVLAGRRLTKEDTCLEKAWSLLPWGLGLVGLGLGWGLVFPFNRWLWTSSFMVFVAGAGLILLAGCMLLTQYQILAPLHPFRMMGANAITVYLASSLVAKALYILPGQGQASLHYKIYAHLAAWLPWGAWASFGWSLGYCLVMLGLAWVLYARGVIIKV